MGCWLPSSNARSPHHRSSVRLPTFQAAQEAASPAAGWGAGPGRSRSRVGRTGHDWNAGQAGTGTKQSLLTARKASEPGVLGGSQAAHWR